MLSDICAETENFLCQFDDLAHYAQLRNFISGFRNVLIIIIIIIIVVIIRDSVCIPVIVITYKKRRAKIVSKKSDAT